MDRIRPERVRRRKGQGQTQSIYRPLYRFPLGAEVPPAGIPATLEYAQLPILYKNQYLAPRREISEFHTTQLTRNRLPPVISLLGSPFQLAWHTHSRARRSIEVWIESQLLRAMSRRKEHASHRNSPPVVG